MEAELLDQIAKLPRTTVVPFPHGGGVFIYRQRGRGCRCTTIWLGRSSSIGLLQDYLRSSLAG